MIKRYVLTKGFLNEDKKIVPFWDPSVLFLKDDDYNKVKLDNTWRGECHEFIDCVYDMKHKTLSLGIEINIYPEKTEFVVGQKVLSEVPKKHRHLRQNEIVEIVYEEFQIRICKGKNLTDELRAEYIPKDVDLNGLYCIKHWEPTYCLKSGMKTKWAHQLYHIN